MTTISRGQRITGWILSALIGAFLIFDGVFKIMSSEQAAQAAPQLGWPASTLPSLGWLLLLCTALYLVPRTSIGGALLLTGYLGGAVATHVRVDDPLLTHTLFPVYMGVALWIALALRSPAARAALTLAHSSPKAPLVQSVR
jgi:hypothetical protein